VTVAESDIPFKFPFRQLLQFPEQGLAQIWDECRGLQESNKKI